MSPCSMCSHRTFTRLPRRCGDVPYPRRRSCRSRAVAPQVRGCPYPTPSPSCLGAGCPAGAGMSLRCSWSAAPACRLPRRCGDVPVPVMFIASGFMVAPQVRGCPSPSAGVWPELDGCPAGAGMSRPLQGISPARPGLPRRCGDVPQVLSPHNLVFRVAPQVRGCPVTEPLTNAATCGCPAGAGMSRVGDAF